MYCQQEGYISQKNQLTIRHVKNQSELSGVFVEDGRVCKSKFHWNDVNSVWFESSSFEEFPNGLVHSGLLSINVSNVGLLRVKPSDFSNGQNLRELDLSHNKLKVLEDKLFNSEAFKNCCKFLTVLELQHNKIQKINMEILKLMSSNPRYIYHQKVDVSHNQLTELMISKNVASLNAGNNKVGRLSLEPGFVE